MQGVVSDDPVIIGLLAKKAELGGLLIDLEDQASRIRRDLMALGEALKLFGVVEPEPIPVPNKVARRKTKEGFRRGELCRRVIEKIRDAAEPVAPADIGRAIMRECLMDTGDQKLYFAFQHKICNVVRRQWQRGVLEQVPGEEGFPARWKVADF